MRFLWFQDRYSLTFLTNKDIIRFNLSKMASKGQSLSIELFLDLLNDLLPFYVNIQEVNGISGSLQDNLKLSQ